MQADVTGIGELKRRQEASRDVVARQLPDDGAKVHGRLVTAVRSQRAAGVLALLAVDTAIANTHEIVDDSAAVLRETEAGEPSRAAHD